MRRIYVGKASGMFGGGGMVKEACGGAGRGFRLFKNVSASVAMDANITECPR